VSLFVWPRGERPFVSCNATPETFTSRAARQLHGVRPQGSGLFTISTTSRLPSFCELKAYCTSPPPICLIFITDVIPCSCISSWVLWLIALAASCWGVFGVAFSVFFCFSEAGGWVGCWNFTKRLPRFAVGSDASLAFSNWTTWDGVDAILPLVHRPAHYHGLLISLAAFNVLLRPDRSRRDWILQDCSWD